MNALNTHIGAAWLQAVYNLNLCTSLPVTSRIGGRRATFSTPENREEVYPETMRPPSTFVGHLQFHLRHELPHLEFLSRLFSASGPQPIQDWVNEEPTGQYARRAAFLYEWLTGAQLIVPANLGGNYADAVDSEKMFCSSPNQIIKKSRWRINDNLPGTRFFCPVLLKTEAVSTASSLDVKALFKELSDEFGSDVLFRAAAWMTLRESKASFTIEGEADKATRIQRFADVIGRRTGMGDLPLDEVALAEIQAEILGSVTSIDRFGLRSSPVFVGETIRHQEVVHYIAPPADDLVNMLDGLKAFLVKTQGQSPVMRSAVASFAFVYIHPLADGNGRVHRFLINDILRRDGVLDAPVILPVSAVIGHPANRQHYDSILDRVSKPMMNQFRGQVEFVSERTRYSDGVVSNFQFSGVHEARPAWRYLHLGDHVCYLSKVIYQTISDEMREESRYLRSHYRARSAIKEIIEMPDAQADRVIRSVMQNEGSLSNVLAKEVPQFKNEEIWSLVTAAVKSCFGADPSEHDALSSERPH